ncbi:DUF3857 domain-containing protein [Aestuariibaculum sediminum]|uniref:DUF3857 domain-containing protein n=1 Tax=Aestuariibaculum sediminum TaxID=2770637 RepID=A0A8J6U821_9FLAO|nr:DUF3857 domain-containing protein [Aestuariibaculum sediminum]MBD0832695.1 DUF3857 domain-containing protein [Aestuariibaculum sediminum]
MTRFFTAFIFLLNLTVYSQEKYHSYTFDVKPEEITSNTFSKDSVANAFVIYEKGNSYVDPEDFKLKSEVICKLKILNREAFNQATIEIPLYHNDKNSESVNKIEAKTYNLENGKMVVSKLSRKDIHEEDYNEHYKLVKFALPNIKEGSVITYSYELSLPFMFNYQPWDFQSDIPKLYSEYNTSIPANWHYHIKLIGGKKLSVNESKKIDNCLTTYNGGAADCLIAKYVMKDIPAFTEEEYMTTKSNYLARIEYELKTFQDFNGMKNNYAKTWETVDTELKKEKSIGRQLTKSLDVHEFLPDSIINETQQLKKAKGIYAFVQNNYTWNGKYSIYNDDLSVKDLIEEKTGNVSSINILLHNLMKASNIDVKPVILSTRNNGFITEIFPVISEFNYLMIQTNINGKSYFLDATGKYLAFGQIPYRCLNNKGRLLDFENGSSWINIEPMSKSFSMIDTHLIINENNQITGTIKKRATGYFGLPLKEHYFSNESNYIETLESTLPQVELTNYKALTKAKNSTFFQESYDVNYHTDKINGVIYLNPFLDKFTKENPFKLQERSYPIDFGFKQNYIYQFKINLGENYSLLEKPEDINIALPNGEGLLKFSSVYADNSIQLLLKFSLNSPIYPSEYYPYLKEIFKKLVDIQQNSIFVLKPNS